MAKIIAITGANKGLGKAIIEKIIQEAPEFDVVLMTSRNTERGFRTKGELEMKYGKQSRLHYQQLDVTSLESIRNFAEFVQKTYGHIDVFVNNAAIYSKTGQFTIDIVQSTLDSNFYGLVNVTEVILPLMRENGHIINVSSRMGSTQCIPDPEIAERFLSDYLTREELFRLAHDFLEGTRAGNWVARGWPTQAYSVSKVLVNGYTRVLDRELRDRRIKVKVNSVCPGHLRTDMGGPSAPFSVDEGTITPMIMIKYTGEESGRFWYNGGVQEWA
ncbi:unnamed protein product [Blepharisma stoltei]|uniref:Carbonyl reductase n=1 Tax=Blepharisma stoltei TaxID=1481888 RepID=A0AAU9K726_9CILI|nr:unnamed protein product [Blepharisma stoltei]